MMQQPQSQQAQQQPQQQAQYQPPPQQSTDGTGTPPVLKATPPLVRVATPPQLVKTNTVTSLSTNNSGSDGPRSSFIGAASLGGMSGGGGSHSNNLLIQALASQSNGGGSGRNSFAVQPDNPASRRVSQIVLDPQAQGLAEAALHNPF